MTSHRDTETQRCRTMTAAALMSQTESLLVPLRCIDTWVQAFWSQCTSQTGLVVSDLVVVEIKSVERFNPVFVAQMLTYLEITGLRVGLILNFNRALMRDGIKRVML